MRGVIGNDAAHGPTFYFEYKLDICWETGSEEENSMKILNVTTYSKAILLPIGKAAVLAPYLDLTRRQFVKLYLNIF